MGVAEDLLALLLDLEEYADEEELSGVDELAFLLELGVLWLALNLAAPLGPTVIHLDGMGAWMSCIAVSGGSCHMYVQVEAHRNCLVHYRIFRCIRVCDIHIKTDPSVWLCTDLSA